MNCATPLLSWGKNILEQSDPNGEEILKLDEAKSQIRNCKLDRSNLRFRNFGFKVSLRPISNPAASALDSSSMLMPSQRKGGAKREPGRAKPQLKFGRNVSSAFQYLLHVVHLPFGFLDGAARPPILPLEQADDRIVAVADQCQAFLDGRVAGTQLNVGPLIPLAVVNVEVRDPVVMLPEVCHRVVVAGGVMTNVEVDHE